MLVKTFTFKNITLEIHSNKISPDNLYYNPESGDFKTLDENYLLREVNSYRTSPAYGKRKKVAARIDLVASSQNELNSFIKSENAWVERECKKINPKALGGAKVILNRLK
jgi:hypothetical protein